MSVVDVKDATKEFKGGTVALQDIELQIEQGAFVSLIGTYFLRARGLDIAKTGWMASLPLWGGAVGGIVGGWLNDSAIDYLRPAHPTTSGSYYRLFPFPSS